jgi:hypothetical protein
MFKFLTFVTSERDVKEFHSHTALSSGKVNKLPIKIVCNTLLLERI